MTSREIIRASLGHKESGCVAVDFGSTSVTGMHVAIVAALREYYGLEKRPVKVHEPYQMLGLLEDDLQKVIGIDVEGISPYETLFGFRNDGWKLWKLPNGLEVFVPGNFRTVQDADCNTLIFPAGDISVPPSGRMPKNGYFFDSIIRQEPIDEDTLNVQDNLEEFGPVTDQAIEYFRLEACRAQATERGVIANFGGTAFGDIALVPAPFLKHPKGIRDIEEWYLSTLTRQDYIHQIFDRQSHIAIENLEKIRPVTGDAIDAVFLCGTDFGTQTSRFCSVETFRSLYMPYYKRLNDWIHANTSWKTFKHSCGAVEPLIDSLIEAGFDILNPVQCSAAGMDPALLKRKYGERIVFWGGGVDTQKTLPFGKPEEVREEVLRRCEIFSKGGGFVFNTIHNVQGNTPVTNVIAMIEALKEFNGQQ